MQNIQVLQQSMQAADLDALILCAAKHVRYATGFPADDGAVLLTQKKAWLLVDSRYLEAAQQKAEGVEVRLFSREDPLHAQMKALLDAEGAQRVGAEEKTLTHHAWQELEKELSRTLLPGSAVIEDRRQIKYDWEKASMIAAQRIAEAALDDVLGILKPGMTEYQVAAELTYRMMLRGGEGNAFDPISVTGVRTSMPHGVPTDNVIQAGDFVTMDFGCIKDGYRSDMTRTVAIGHASDEMRRVYDTVRKAQETGIAMAKAGVTGKDIHDTAAAVIAQAGYGAYFGHGFGHGVGLDIHEDPYVSPKNPKPLPAGAVVTAEPGIYLPGRFGVRIEDMLYITETGCENLTKAPKDLIIL